MTKKLLKVSQDILPLGEFKAQAASILRTLDQRETPLVITQNGRPACVVMSPAEFDRMQERQAFVEALTHGLEDIRSGRVLDHESFMNRLQDEFGDK